MNIMNSNVDGMSKINYWSPSVIEETSGGYTSVNVLSKHFTNRKIFITGVVTEDLANDFATEMMYLSESSDKPIDIFINSPGGSVQSGLMMYDIIQACGEKAEINMYCMGLAASMAAILLAGGQKGHRYILPHSSVMIHEPLINGGLGGSATSIKKTADSIMDTKATICKILAKHTGKTYRAVEKAISYDHYLNSSEAVEFGICDEVKNFV